MPVATHWLGNLFLTFLDMSWHGAILILIALLLYIFLDKKLHPKWRSLISMAIMFRLMLPVYPAAGLSLFNIDGLRPPDWGNLALHLSASSPSGSHGTSLNPGLDNYSKQPAVNQVSGLNSKGETGALPGSPKNESGVALKSSIIEVLACGWLAIAITLLAFLAISHLLLIVRIRRSVMLPNPQLKNLVDSCRSELGIRRTVAVIETDRISGPALLGLFKPRILLPKGILTSFSLQELRYVFLHELCHLQRQDLTRIWLAAVLRAIHWFNPMVWLAARRIGVEADLSCDGIVLSYLSPGEQVAYGRTMLKALRLPHSEPEYCGVARWLDDWSDLRERIRGVAAFENNRKKSRIPAFALFAVLLPVGLTDARQSENTVMPARQSSQQQSDEGQSHHLIYGRLVDEERRPVPGAVIALKVDRQKLGSFTTADADGRFVWDAGLESTVTLDITAPGFLHPRFLHLRPGDQEHEIHLYREGNPWSEKW